MHGSADERLLSALRRHWRWTVLGLIVAGIAAATRFAAIGVLPPSIKMKPFAHVDASSAVVVGTAWRLGASGRDVYGPELSPRSYALADMINSPEITNDVARAAGLPASKIGILGPLWSDQMRTQQWPNGPKRSSQIVIEKDPYQITINQEATTPDGEPALGVYTQAPSREIAARLASAVPVGLSQYLEHLEATAGVPKRYRYGVSQLGAISVVPARRSQLANVGLFTFLAVFVVWCGAMIGVSSLRRDLRAAAGDSEVGGGSSRCSDTGGLVAGTR